jgi:hypothetical protein
VGLSLQFDLLPRKNEQDETVEKLRGYLEEKKDNE